MLEFQHAVSLTGKSRDRITASQALPAAARHHDILDYAACCIAGSVIQTLVPMYCW